MNNAYSRVKCVVGLMAVAVATAANAVTIDVQRYWKDGEEKAPVPHISWPDAQYPYQEPDIEVDSGATQRFLALTPDEGYEVTQWIYGSPGATTLPNKITTGLSNNKLTCDFTCPRGFVKLDLAVCYEVLSYAINYDGNGATSGSTASQTGLKYFNSVSLSASGFAKTGYRFAGWSTAKGGSADYPAGTTVSGSTFGMRYDKKAVTLYAVWTPIPSIVTFDADGGTFPNGAKSVTREQKYDAKFSLPENPTRGGYIFDNYWTNSVGTRVTSETVVKTTTAMTLYAAWRSVGNLRVDAYYVADEQGAGGSVTGSGSFAYGEVRKVQANANTGSKFVKWTIDSETGTEVGTETTLEFTVTKKVTYYAHFVLDAYTVIWKYKDSQGRDAETREVVKYKQTAHPPEDGTRGYEDFAFDKWDKNYDSITGDITINAVYVSNVLTVTFEPNGASSVSETTRKLHKGDKYGELPIAERTGYTATEAWWTSKDGGTPVYPDTDVTLVGSQVLYPHWTANTYRVTFDGNGATPSKGEMTVTFGERYGTLPTVKRDGYTHEGWFLSKDEEIRSSTIVTTAEDHTLTAQWTAKTYWLEFDSRGGTSVDEKQVTYDDAYPALEEPTLEGYRFVGWFTEIVGGSEIKAGNRVRITENTRVYAHWQKKTYTVKFNGGSGAEGRMDDMVVGIAEATNLTVNAFAKTGHTFLNWSAESGATYANGAKIEKGTFGEGDVLALTANWKPNTYTVRFYANGGSGAAMADQSFTYGVPQELSACTYNRDKENLSFKGWTKDPADGTIDYSDKESVLNLTSDPDGLVQLFAVWKGSELDNAYSKAAGCSTDVPGDHKAVKLLPSDTEYVKVVSDGVDEYVKIDGTAESLLLVGLEGAGTLTFKYKTEFRSSGSYLGVFVDGSVVPALTIPAGVSEWTETAVISRNATSSGGTIDISLNLFRESGAAAIDEIKWMPKEWNTGSVGITFRLNDGTEAPADIVTNLTRTVKKAIGTLPTMARDGFLGWATDSEALSPDVTTDWLVPVSDTQLYAVWKSSNPEPTPEDAPVIGSDFAFETKPDFDYVIKCATTLANGGNWTQYGGVIKGDGKEVRLPIPPLGDAAGEDASRYGCKFFKVEVIQRGSK